MPLALYGVVILHDGTKIDIAIGDDEDDPVFCINDLLPHLSSDQNQKKLHEAIGGEDLNVLIGSIPFDYISYFANVFISSSIFSTKSSSFIAPTSPSFLLRTPTSPASCSLSPTTSMYGTF